MVRVIVFSATFIDISYIVAVRFNGRGNRSSLKKSPHVTEKLDHIMLYGVHLV